MVLSYMNICNILFGENNNYNDNNNNYNNNNVAEKVTENNKAKVLWDFTNGSCHRSREARYSGARQGDGRVEEKGKEKREKH